MECAQDELIVDERRLTRKSWMEVRRRWLLVLTLFFLFSHLGCMLPALVMCNTIHAPVSRQIQTKCQLIPNDTKRHTCRGLGRAYARTGSSHANSLYGLCQRGNGRTATSRYLRLDGDPRREADAPADGRHAWRVGLLGVDLRAPTPWLARGELAHRTCGRPRVLECAEASPAIT